MLFRKSPEERRQEEFERQCRQATLEVINRGRSGDNAVAWPFEVIEVEREKHVKRLRSSFFFLGSLISLIIGGILLSREYMAGGFFILTLAPFLLLYPPIRFLFGGKDSIGAVVTTATVEEVIKGEILKAANNVSKRRKRK